jgi:ABC-2 type transport system permease protein
VLLLGTVGVFFSTVFKKTMIAVIMTYGFTLFIFAFTGLLAIFIEQVMHRNNGQSLIFGYILSLNPLATLIGIISPDFSRSIFNNHPNLQLWYFFVPVYSVVSLLMLWLSVRYLRPRLRNAKGKFEITPHKDL